MANKIDLTTDTGMTKALNDAYAEYEVNGDRPEALTRSNLVGRGIAIRNLRLREKQFDRDRKRGAKAVAK